MSTLIPCVLILQDPPYVINLTEPNEQGRMHEGFIVDLLDELSYILGFNYTIYEVADRGYGSETASGKWDGMIGDLIERDANVSPYVILKYQHHLTTAICILYLLLHHWGRGNALVRDVSF